MDEKHLLAWSAVTRYLKTAALFSQQRDEMVSRALQELLTSIPAAGTALLRPSRDGKSPWKVQYAGIRQQEMRRWLSARLNPSLDVLIGVLQHDLTRHLADMPPPLFIRLQTSIPSLRGLWIVWPALPSSLPLAGTTMEGMERVRRTLEALLEVEEREEAYFSQSSPLCDQELIEALAHDDTHALTAFLSLARVVGKADFTFWGRAYQDVVEVTGHLGAMHSGFGFALARGHGVGGRVAASGQPIVNGDYLNSPYRDPSVSDIVDGEQIRAGMALPVRYHIANDNRPYVAAVLYATRRTATPFSLAEGLLVQRLARLLEPLPLQSRSVPFVSPGVPAVTDQKMEWYDIVLHASRVEPLEAWVSQFIKGTVIVTDSDDNPYVHTHSEQLEQMKAARDSQPDEVHVLSLAAPGVLHPGKVYLCPSISLPPPQWPNFCADLVMACNLVIARLEQARDQLERQREQWIRALLQGKSPRYVEQDGYRLGLPVEHGQLWILAWPAGTMQTAKSARKRMIAESVVLDSLKSPLMFFDDDLAVVLLNEQHPQTPSRVRDALLTHCGVHPLWIIYGVRYHSLQDLKMKFAHAIATARKARRDEYENYLLDIYTFGLDSLLDNPRLAEDLDAFARKLLTPLIEYDAANGSHLTETFVLAQTLGSAQAAAERLALHVNTIRYRLHRAEEILGTDQTSPKERAALAMAAFTWAHLHPSEHLPS